MDFRTIATAAVLAVSVAGLSEAATMTFDTVSNGASYPEIGRHDNGAGRIGKREYDRQRPWFQLLYECLHRSLVANYGRHFRSGQRFC